MNENIGKNQMSTSKMMDLSQRFSTFKSKNPTHKPSPQQYYLNSKTLPDYSGGMLVDMNNNYGAGRTSFGDMFKYFHDNNVLGPNYSNNNFPNHNYKMKSQYCKGASYLSPHVEVNLHSSLPALSTNTCQYATSYGSASCFHRNRYMPYNHNRSCAIAAATSAEVMRMRSVGNGFCSNLREAKSMLVAGNASAVPPPLLYSNYQQFAMNNSNLIPYTPQQTPITMPHFGLETSNAFFVAAYEQNAPAEQIETTPFALNMYSNFTNLKRVTEAESDVTYTTAQDPVVYSKSFTTAPCMPGSGLVSNAMSSDEAYAQVTDLSQAVSLRLTNLDYNMDEESLHKFLLSQLKPITPVISLTFEDKNFATVTVPDSYYAKQVVAHLHRKKIGHKRMVVSYTRDSSLTEANTLRCQVAGLLKDVPYNRLPVYKFRELFQSRFKTSISVLDLYAMRDICIISSDGNEEKFINLVPNLVNSLENSSLMEGLQHTVPYCKEHFTREQHKGWAEQEIEPLPCVFMKISEIQNILYSLLKSHNGDIPVSSLIHCIEGQMKIKIQPNENGVNLEHLVCCIQGIQIQINNFGIKILSWLESDRKSLLGNSSASMNNISNSGERSSYIKSADPLCQITREVIELVKMSPKSTMKFSKFIPAYHNHFGKQCRVADYGYTKLIELFEALSSVVQIMGDGENRQITLTHRTQIRRFTSDLLRSLRSTGNKSILLSDLPQLFAKTQSRTFDITDYGVCDVSDILNGLVYSNVVVVSKVPNGNDLLISIPKRQQTHAEIEKTCVFAAEMVELFQNAPQYTILFQKFVRSYHYHFSYQCRLSDYGFLKLADLMDSIHGVVEMDRTNDEERRIFLSPVVARRVFAEQSEELIRITTGSSKTPMKLKEVMKLHKKKYGYQIQPESLGVEKLEDAIELLPYVEVFQENGETWITCHNHDSIFRTLCYRACRHLLAYDPNMYCSSELLKNSNNDNSSTQKRSTPRLDDFVIEFNAKYKENLTTNMVKAMSFAIEISVEGYHHKVRISSFMNFLINIVRLLEQRSVLLLNEIRHAMNCTITTTFSYGYPNLFTLLMAYPDIFIVNLGISQESSEVRLAPNCELIMQRSFSNTHRSRNNTNNFTKILGNTLNYSRLPPPLVLTERNGRNSNASFNVTRFSNMSDGGFIEDHNLNNSLSQQTNTGHHNENTVLSFSSSYDSYNNTGGYANCLNSTLLNNSLSHLSDTSNKENSFSNSYNSPFNSTNISLVENNASLSGNSIYFSSSVNSSGRNYSLSKQNSTVSKRTNPHNEDSKNTQTLPPLIVPKSTTPSQILDTPLITQSSLYSIISSIQNGPPGTPVCDPPKPDSPPSQKLPFWIDPVWSDSTKSKPNMYLPRLKPSDGHGLPIVLSPYTLSKIENLNKVFTFETLDRKIA